MNRSMLALAKRAAVFLGVAAGFLSAFGALADDPNSRSLIIVGSETDYPPYALVSKDGRADGFSVDLMKAVSEAMGIEAVFKVGTWDEVRAALESGVIDALPLVSYSKEREKIFDFTMPHTVADAVVFKRGQAPDIESVSSLRDQTIVVMRSDAAHDWLVRNDLSGKLVLTDTLPEAFRLLATGKHDYVLAPRLVGLLTIRELGLSDIETTGPLIDAYGRGYGFAVKKGNTALLLKFNEGLRVIKETGRYDAIYEKWFGVVDRKGPSSDLVARYVLWASGWIAVVGVIAFIWIVILQRMVRGRTAELAKARDDLELRVAERTRELENKNFVLDAVITGSSNAVFVKDRDGRFILANRRAARNLGLEPEDMIGRKAADFLPPEFIPKMEAEDRAVMETGIATEIEETIRYKIGERIVRAFKTPYRDSEGNIIGVIGIVRDITERKRAEQELVAQRQLLDTIIETIPHGIFWKNRDLTYAGCNSKAARNWYLDKREDLIGKTTFDLARDRVEAELLTARDRVVIDEGKALINFEDNHLRADGTVATHLSSKLPLRDAAGNVTGLLCIFLDITDRLAAEKQLRQAQRAKALGSLAGGIAHELNNLLLPITALSKMAEKRAPEDSPERVRLGKIVEASERAAEIVHQILTFSREDDEEKSIVDMASVVGEATRLLNATLPSNVAFRCQQASGIGAVRAVSSQIQTVVVNLVTNSAEALEGRPGDVVLSLDRLELDADAVREFPELQPGPYARIAVSDTGKGISPDIIDRVLDPFFTTKEAGDGIGMGLATVHAIATRHDGAVRVFSKPETGTRVDVYFPLINEREALVSVSLGQD
jgi:PAS domain S-box-containing protein